MRPIGADHVNRSSRKILSLLASFAVAATLFRFGTAHFQAERTARVSRPGD